MHEKSPNISEEMIKETPKERLINTYWKLTKHTKLTYQNLEKYFPLPKIITPIIERPEKPQYPIILLHGYWNTLNVWNPYLSYFELNGYILNKNLYRFDGRGPNKSPAIIDIRINAQKLKNLVEFVKGQTKASKVILIAHSMGGLISRWYIEQMEGVKNVHKLIMLGTPNRGSDYLPLFSRIVETIDDKIDILNEETKNLKDESESQLTLLTNKIKKLPEKMAKAKSNIIKLTKITISKIDKNINKITSEEDIDHLGMAAVQMTPGSNFLTTLGYKALPIYYLIFGTQGLPKKFISPGENDCCVHVKSAILDGMPENHMRGFKLNHNQLHTKNVVFNQIMEYIYADY